MRYLLLIVLMPALFILTACNSVDTDAKLFFEKFTELEQSFDKELANLYFEDADIIIARMQPNGKLKKIKMTGSQYKQLIINAMDVARIKNDYSSYDNIKYKSLGDSVKITAERYSNSRCYTDKGYYMIIEKDDEGDYLIGEESSTSQKESDC